MTIKKIKQILPLLLLLSAGCIAPNKERANEYYNEFSSIIVPYKEGTERILKEMQALLQKQMKASGNFKLSRQDSITQQGQIQEFKSLAEQTVNALHTLEDLPDSDLAASGIEYVRRSSEAVLGAFHEIAIPMQQGDGLDQAALDSLSEKFSNELVNSNEEFAARQIEFLKRFEVISTQ